MATDESAERIMTPLERELEKYRADAMRARRLFTASVVYRLMGSVAPDYCEMLTAVAESLEKQADALCSRAKRVRSRFRNSVAA